LPRRKASGRGWYRRRARECEFERLAEPFEPAKPFPDALRNLQYRDIRYTKIPRALRFNDRASMRSSAELREPFLDHRLVELAIRQRPEWKIAGDTRKWLLRRIASRLVPSGVAEAPKRPVQTPQREWLCGECRRWATDCIEVALEAAGGSWLQPCSVREAWREYGEGNSDNSFYIWQWISLGLMLDPSCHRN
jgi:asparagine synthase (glutamine-hydrolysing)